MSDESSNPPEGDASAGVSAEAATPAANSEPEQFAPDELQQNASGSKSADLNLDLILDVPVRLSLRVGSTEISIRDLVQLVEGSVIALEQDSSAAMDVLVNGTLIAHGEIVIVDDRFGVRLTDVVSPTERIEKIN
ncbi:MAG: flagellar motor switch protein FliN [Gammaproteobacteria bacterium]|nr:flagellar motor switch protein FliN [Gammaproteobacteria bacterium]